MEYLQSLLYLAVGFAASIAGAICGVGGGIIVKPVLDVLGWASVPTISFLSGCMVLSMSCCSVILNLQRGRQNKKAALAAGAIHLETATPLAIGAAAGGILGKILFDFLKDLFPSQNTVGAVQSAVLVGLTLLCLLFTLYKSKIRNHALTGLPVCLTIGLVLGLFSSFLGIGGGPINLVLLTYFFGMDSKTAAANSLYLILFSQAANLLFSLCTGGVPAFHPFTLLCMILGGVGGSLLGRKLSSKMNNAAVDKLFLIMMTVIIVICIFNTWRYAQA